MDVFTLVCFLALLWSAHGQLGHDNNTWPKGTYAMVKTLARCPDDGVTWWREGWVYHDTDDTIHFLNKSGIWTGQLGNNSWSGNITDYIDGIFHTSHIQISFCVKEIENSNSGPGGATPDTWPSGTYCLYKKGNCPTGFSEGLVYFDDEDTTNNNHHKGVIPDGYYDTRNIQEEFCCRHDMAQTTPIHLPNINPFILIRHRGMCQQVQGMDVEDIFIRFDTEKTNSENSFSGEHPAQQLIGSDGSQDIQLNYCFYNNAKSPTMFASASGHLFG